jgi:hypothetical protein
VRILAAIGILAAVASVSGARPALAVIMCDGLVEERPPHPPPSQELLDALIARQQAFPACREREAAARAATERDPPSHAAPLGRDHGSDDGPGPVRRGPANAGACALINPGSAVPMPRGLTQQERMDWLARHPRGPSMSSGCAPGWPRTGPAARPAEPSDRPGVQAVPAAPAPGAAR